MKRIFVLICFASVVISLFAVTAFGADATTNGYTVIDYNDYISNFEVQGDNDLITVTLPDNMYSMTMTDIYGSDYKEGLSSWVMYLEHSFNTSYSAGVFCPSGAVGKRYLDLSNIPNGAVFYTTNKIKLEPSSVDPNGVFDLKYRSRISYFDADFKLISSQTSTPQDVSYIPNVWEYELEYEATINKPDNAMYCMTYFYFDVLSFPYNYGRIASIAYEYEKPKLTMSISSLYRLQEQTGKTNEILVNLEKVVNADAEPQTPEQAGAVGDLSDLEDNLTADTEQGREEAEIVFNESSNVVLSHIQGFFFLGMVVEWIFGVGWIRGLLTVSLSLGIFAFIVNIASNLGKSIEHRSSGGKGKGG